MNKLKAGWEKLGHIIILFGFGALVYFIGNGAIVDNLQTRWFFMMIALLILIAIIGYTSNGRVDGVLIDWRNKMSLTRLQIVLWTILGMSAFLTIGIHRISIREDIVYKEENAYEQARAVGDVECLKDVEEELTTKLLKEKCPPPEALHIVFPEELLLAMGISVASFAGASLVKRSQSNITLVHGDKEIQIKNDITDKEKLIKDTNTELEKETNKYENYKAKKEEAMANEEGDEKEIIKANLLLSETQNRIDSWKETIENTKKEISDLQEKLKEIEKNAKESKGLLHVNDHYSQASFSDIFTKELSGEIHLIDISKLQMFFFTITVIFAYAAALSQFMQQNELITNPFGVALPLFSSSLVVLLGISHGGYLAIKNTNTSATNAKKDE